MRTGLLLHRRHGAVAASAVALLSFAVTGAGLALGLLEGFADLAPVGAWWLYGLGMATWGVTSLVLDRRLRWRNRLRDLRAARGWTQADLAERLDVSRQTVISLERGRYDPSLPLALAIARLFGCAIEGVFHDREGLPAWEATQAGGRRVPDPRPAG